MKKNPIILIACLAVFVLFWQNAFSNGGPLDDICEIKTGKHSFKNVEAIRLVNEKLDIKILGDYVQYNVDYTFENKGNTVTLAYGFPIEFVTGRDAGADTLKTRFEVIKSFQMTDSGREVKCETSFEKAPLKSSDDWAKWKLWYRSKLYFEKNESKHLQVEFTVKSTNDDEITTKSFLPNFSNRTTNYSFKGAKYWGNGKADSVSINIDSSALAELGGRVTSVEPGEFKKTNNTYSLTYKNISLDAIPDLLITYENEQAAFAGYIKSSMIPREDIESITASSTLADKESANKRYCAENMLDGSYETAWAAWNPGQDDLISITVKLKKPYHIRGVGILNGYLKNEKTYNENGKAGSISVKPGCTRSAAGITERKYSDFKPNAPDFIDWIADCGEGLESTRSVSLEIQSVLEGSKYAQVAISEIYILGWVDRE